MIESYGPRERIRRKKDFSAIYARGRSQKSRYFTLIYLPGDQGHSRMAAVSSRKVGGAVERNKARRRARDLFRRNKDLLKTPLDILVITRKAIVEAPWPALQAEFRAAIETIWRMV